MSRIVTIFNLLGVLVLAGLCAVQWQANRRLHLGIIRAESTQLAQADCLAQQDQTIKGYIADLDDFRSRLARATVATQEAQAKLAAAAADRQQLVAERDQFKKASEQFKAAVEQWTAAVAVRDKTLQQAEALARKLAAERNDAVVKFNDMVGQYNVEAAQIKLANDQIQKLAAQRDDAVAKFNDLANQYNALVKASGRAAGKQ